jgi:hypothetical protein
VGIGRYRRVLVDIGWVGRVERISRAWVQKQTRLVVVHCNVNTFTLLVHDTVVDGLQENMHEAQDVSSNVASVLLTAETSNRHILERKP